MHVNLGWIDWLVRVVQRRNILEEKGYRRFLSSFQRDKMPDVSQYFAIGLAAVSSCSRFVWSWGGATGASSHRGAKTVARLSHPMTPKWRGRLAWEGVRSTSTRVIFTSCLQQCTFFAPFRYIYICQFKYTTALYRPVRVHQKVRKFATK